MLSQKIKPIEMCSHCRLRYVYDEHIPNCTLCWICVLKSKGSYNTAIKEVKLDWCGWGFITHISDKKLGWSFVGGIKMAMMFAAIANCGSLNQVPKYPNFNIKKHVSTWRLEITEQYYLY